jgi:hypothetical protein
MEIRRHREIFYWADEGKFPRLTIQEPGAVKAALLNGEIAGYFTVNAPSAFFADSRDRQRGTTVLGGLITVGELEDAGWQYLRSPFAGYARITSPAGTSPSQAVERVSAWDRLRSLADM